MNICRHCFSSKDFPVSSIEVHEQFSLRLDKSQGCFFGIYIEAFVNMKNRGQVAFQAFTDVATTTASGSAAISDTGELHVY